MKMDDYQDLTATTTVYDPGFALEYLTLGLVSEAGEVAGKVKRLYRGDLPTNPPVHNDSVAKELGDVLWYVSRLAAWHGYTLSEVAYMNNDKLTQRKLNGTLKGKGDDR